MSWRKIDTVLPALLEGGYRLGRPAAAILVSLGIVLPIVLTLAFSGPTERRSLSSPPERSSAAEAVQWMDRRLDRVWGDLGLTLEDFELVAVEPRVENNDRWYLRIFELQPSDRKQFDDVIRRLNNLQVKEGHALETRWSGGENNGKRLDLKVDGYLTHEIFVRPAAVPPPSPILPLPSPPPPAPRIALIVDDLGNRYASVRPLLDLDIPLTLAVFPKRPFSRTLAEEGHARGFEVMLHLPMEPWGYPEKNPGAGALLVDMNEADLKRTLLEDLQDIPQARGVNNHMGSRFTEQSLEMAEVMDILSKRGLFFVDSLTTPRSRGYQAAEEKGVPAYRRDVFLDVVQDKQAIRRQFRKLMRLAEKRGYAVGICHPYPETLALLNELYKESSRAGIRWVTVSRLHQTPPVAPPPFMTAGSR
jgi:polysaccharide deacetylase 2 family uncharacterized protein YibQ